MGSMGEDHVVLIVDPVVGSSPETVGSSYSSSNIDVDVDARVVKHEPLSGEETALLLAAECRICQDEDTIPNLEMPCACSGSLNYAHRKCIQHWCNEKGDTTCEICHQAYQPGYTAPPLPLPQEETVIDIDGSWAISGTPLDLQDNHRLLTMSETDRRLLEAEYDEYAATNVGGAAFCRSAALILMALLLFRHALDVTDSDGDDETTTFLSLFLLRAAGFLLPCYIMAWAISILQRRRQRQETAAMAGRQGVAIVVQSGGGGERRGLQFTIARTPAGHPPQLPL